MDGEIHAGDVRTFIGGEEGDGRRDFLWLASATHRDLRSELGGRLLGLLRRKARRCLQSRRFDRSGAHGIHPNSAVFQLQCPSTREVSHSRLAGGVGAETWKIGRASCRERVCQYVYISVVAVALNKNKEKIRTIKNVR